MRALLRKDLQTTYLDPEIHYDLTIVAATERKPIREVLENIIQNYIIHSGLQTVVEAAKKQASIQ